jgi:hypothetical protein
MYRLRNCTWYPNDPEIYRKEYNLAFQDPENILTQDGRSYLPEELKPRYHNGPDVFYRKKKCADWHSLSRLQQLFYRDPAHIVAIGRPRIRQHRTNLRRHRNLIFVTHFRGPVRPGYEDSQLNTEISR